MVNKHRNYSRSLLAPRASQECVFSKNLLFLGDYLNNCQHFVEAENINKDLAAMVARIRSGEYRNTDFLDRQQIDTPRRSHEFCQYLLGIHQHAVDWVAILNQLPLAQEASCIDLCTGAWPKIGLALKKLGHLGTLTMLEKDAHAMQQIRQIIELFDPDFAIRFVQQDLFAIDNQAYQLVAGNHVLDDLILNEYAQQQRMELRDIYLNETTFRHCTTEIQKHFDTAAFNEKLAAQLSRLCGASGFIVLTHYSSVTETALQLQNWSQWVLQCFKQLLLSLQQHHYRLIASNLDITTTNHQEKIYFALQQLHQPFSL